MPVDWNHDELTEALTLISNKEDRALPIVLVEKNSGGMIDWIKKVLSSEVMIHEGDLDLFNVVDTPEDAVKVIDDFYAKYLLSPNF